jgi:acyl-coenzyme A synthetase/AMP-(fatty) acid ligase
MDYTGDERKSHECFCGQAVSKVLGAQGFYFTGDGCKRSADGLYTITGRVDDVINVSGHRVGTAEVEAALASHGACIEAAVVG